MRLGLESCETLTSINRLNSIKAVNRSQTSFYLTVCYGSDTHEYTSTKLKMFNPHTFMIADVFYVTSPAVIQVALLA